MGWFFHNEYEPEECFEPAEVVMELIDGELKEVFHDGDVSEEGEQGV